MAFGCYQLVVLGVKRIHGKSAEDIKESTEEIINEYIFDSSKIKGIKIQIKFNFLKFFN